MDASGRVSADRPIRNLRASDLSYIMLVDDPRLRREPQSLEDCTTDNEPEGVISLSDTLLLKTSCSKDEADIIELAGKDIAIPLLARVGSVDTGTFTFHQTSAVIERGVPFVLSEIRAEERLPASLRIIELVSRLHARGVVHGDVSPDVFRWDSEGQLVIGDFANSRLVNQGLEKTIQRCWGGDEEFIAPCGRSNSQFGRCFVPTESDDLFAMSVTLWCIWAGQRPEPGMFSGHSGPCPDLSVITDPDIFGDVVDTLQQGGLNLDLLLPHTPLRGRELSPPFLSHPTEVASRSPSPMFRLYPAGSPHAKSEPSYGSAAEPAAQYCVELSADVPRSAAILPTTLPRPPLPVALLARRNSCPRSSILRLGEWPSSEGLSTQGTQHIRDKHHPAIPLSLTPHISPCRLSPSPQPTEFESDQDHHSDTSYETESESDELDEEVTWEFPFPFMQGLPCSPTDSMACLASPKGPPPPEFAVRVSREQLRLQGHRRVQSVGGILERIQEGDGRLGRMGRSMSNPGWGVMPGMGRGAVSDTKGSFRSVMRANGKLFD